MIKNNFNTLASLIHINGAHNQGSIPYPLNYISLTGARRRCHCLGAVQIINMGRLSGHLLWTWQRANSYLAVIWILIDMVVLLFFCLNWILPKFVICHTYKVNIKVCDKSAEIRAHSCTVLCWLRMSLSSWMMMMTVKQARVLAKWFECYLYNTTFYITTTAPWSVLRGIVEWHLKHFPLPL